MKSGGRWGENGIDQRVVCRLGRGRRGGDGGLEKIFYSVDYVLYHVFIGVLSGYVVCNLTETEFLHK